MVEVDVRKRADLGDNKDCKYIHCLYLAAASLFQMLVVEILVVLSLRLYRETLSKLTALPPVGAVNKYGNAKQFGGRWHNL